MFLLRVRPCEALCLSGLSLAIYPMRTLGETWTHLDSWGLGFLICKVGLSAALSHSCRQSTRGYQTGRPQGTQSV